MTPLPNFRLFCNLRAFWTGMTPTLNGNLRRYDPLQNLRNKLKMGNFEPKSTSICKISVLLAISKPRKYRWFCLRVLMRWKIMHYELGIVGNLGTFGNVLTLPPSFWTETWELFEFSMTLPFWELFPIFGAFYFWRRASWTITFGRTQMFWA